MLDLLKSRFTFKRVLSLLAIVASLLWLTIFSFPDNKLHLIFCDVGQGDATLITKGFEQILIDGGPNDKVLQCLSSNMPFFDKTIEIIALTHPEADHMTGLLSVLDKYQVEYFLTGPERNESAGYQELVRKVLGAEDTKILSAESGESVNGINIKNPYAGEKIRLGEIELKTWWPEREWVADRLDVGNEKLEAGLGNEKLENTITPLTSNSSFPLQTSHFILGAKTTHAKLNDFSLVFLLNYKNKKILLMGDADLQIQDDIAKAISGWQLAISEIDILKFPHHGSKTGMLPTFLEKIQPKEAVISVGKNSYGHPTKEALELLEKYGVKARRTDLEGEIKYSF